MIMVYSKPVTKELLVQVFNESYPEHSTWDIGELVTPEIGNESVAFNYTVFEDIARKIRHLLAILHMSESLKGLL